MASATWARPPLHVAIRQENYELVEALLEAGANPDWTGQPFVDIRLP
ncbi:ankyrin repeat domain-containing protein [Pseudoxanthomonas mexicana]